MQMLIIVTPLQFSRIKLHCYAIFLLGEPHEMPIKSH